MGEGRITYTIIMVQLLIRATTTDSTQETRRNEIERNEDDVIKDCSHAEIVHSTWNVKATLWKTLGPGRNLSAQR